MMWPRRADATQAFAGQGIEAVLPPAGIVGGYEAGFEGGISASPGGPNLHMAMVNREAARRASELLGEEVLPLAGKDWEGDVVPGDVLPAYTPYMRAAYDADTFRPESGDERRIIGDKYRMARDLAGKSAEQFRRARLIDPSIPDLEEQRRQALDNARKSIDRADRANTGFAGTVAWLAGQVMSELSPATNPSWAMNVLGLGGKNVLLRAIGQGVAAGGQQAIEDLAPLAGLPSREEAMRWVGRDVDVVADVLTAAAFGAVIQAGGEALAKGMAFGARRLTKAVWRASPPSERVVLDGMTPDPAQRVRAAQDLDVARAQLNENVPANELQPPAAPLPDRVSVAPDSRASVEPTVRDVPPRSEEEIIARARKLDPEAIKEFNKATKQVDAVTTETRGLIDAATAQMTKQLDTLDAQIAAREADIAKLGKGQRSGQLAELEALELQREIIMDLHQQAMAAIAAKQAKKEAAAAAKMAKWQPLFERARARAQGEWDAQTQAQTQARATVDAARAAATGGPTPAKTAPEPAAASPRPIGETVEPQPPELDHPLARDTGEGSVIERSQRVVDAKSKQAIEDDKAWVSDVKKKLGDYEQAVKAKGDVKPEDITLLDGTPVRDLLNLHATKVEVGNGQELQAVYDLRRELDELDQYGEAQRVVTGCRMRS